MTDIKSRDSDKSDPHTGPLASHTMEGDVRAESQGQVLSPVTAYILAMNNADQKTDVAKTFPLDLIVLTMRRALFGSR